MSVGPLEPRPLWRGGIGADGAGRELALFANAYTAIVAALAALVRWDLPLGVALSLAFATFIVLGLCVRYRGTLWLAALAGTAAIAGGLTLLSATLGFRLYPFGGWVTGALGLVFGLRFAVRSYGRSARHL